MCFSPKSFPSFKTSLELSFRKITHAHMLQRFFETSVQPKKCSSIHGLLISLKRCVLSTCGIWLVNVQRMIRVLQLQKTNSGCIYKQCGIFIHKQTFKISLTLCHVVQQYLLQHVVATPDTGLVHLLLSLTYKQRKYFLGSNF